MGKIKIDSERQKDRERDRGKHREKEREKEKQSTNRHVRIPAEEKKYRNGWNNPMMNY